MPDYFFWAAFRRKQKSNLVFSVFLFFFLITQTTYTECAIFMATSFLLNTSLTNCVVAKKILWLSNQWQIKRSYEVYFDTIIKITKCSLRSVLGGCIEGTHSILRDKSHSCCKVDLKTLEWVMGSSTGPVPKDLLGRNIWINKIGARWRSFILA